MAESQRSAKEIARLEFHEVNAERWPDLVKLFDARGGPKNCYCMVFRASAKEAKDRSHRALKLALGRRVRAGTPIGILGYFEGEAVAWCSIAPRTSFRNLGGLEVDGEDPERVWSLTCFFVRNDFRRSGVSERLIEAARAHAKKHGARVLEAYPVKKSSPSYRFMGRVDRFEAAGFEHVGTAGKRRHVMRRRLGPARRSKQKH